jgi:hypothetical protein
MALKNVVYTYTANWQGQMAEARGYVAPLRWDCLIAFVPLLLYPWLRASGLRTLKLKENANPSL